MDRSVLILCICLAASTAAYGSGLPELVVHNGENSVVLAVRNETARSAQELQVDAEAESLPAWLRISSTKVDWSSEASEQRVVLPVTIMDQPEGTSARVGILLTDREGREWPVQFSVRVSHSLVTEDALLPNMPNPFNPGTTIRYQLAGPDVRPTRLVVYNVLGQVVRALVDEPKMPGVYKVHWDGKDDAGHTVGSGVYIYRLVSGAFSQSRKTLLMK